MKRLIIITSLILACSVIAEEPHSNSVSTNSVIIIPAYGIDNAPAWVGATNTYAQGQVVKNGGRYYWAVTGGISTNLAPIHSMGEGDQARDGVTWRVFDAKRRRIGASVVNTGSLFLSVGHGFPASAGKGIVLSPNGGVLTTDSDYQGAIYAASTGTTTAATSVW